MRTAPLPNAHRTESQVAKCTFSEWFIDMQQKIAEYLTVRRGREKEASSPQLNSNNNGDVLYKYAFVGDFDSPERTARNFVKRLYEDENNSPDELYLYDTGVNFVLLHLLIAWNNWHERTGNVRKSLYIMSYDKKQGKWKDTAWYAYRS